MTVPARTPSPVSTTRQTLVRLRGWLLGVTALTLATSLAVFLGVAGNADVAADRSVPAVLASYDAQDALRNAHLAAVRNLAEGGEVLGGPGVDYQRQIAGAGQYLTLLAENNAAGDRGTQAIQTIEALLVTYTGLIGQADARYRDAGLRALGVAALRDAASLLDDILLRLEDLRGMQLRAFDDQADNKWTNMLTAAVWLLPLVGLGVLLARTQVYLTRRFRRTVNVPLLAATVVTVGMVALTALSLWSADKLDRARAGVEAVHDSRQGQLKAVGFRAADGLANQVKAQCATACDDTIEELRSPFPSPPASSTPGQTVVAADQAIVADADDAADSRSVELALPLLALGIAVLVLWGFRPRLAEYGERST
ncbi:hypothetical protein [Micromonospora parathelypteridis]|uniref:Uncharacterized protein n=1 Tax=Micromonospora parathelypteridis TaxID=1839617 RepID=A0A840VX06_9ACTN|nr:hypothetical protein [Micromonospora parathelypteridis]MBB5481265.1 hypothetical protein [Micromonospora parathelypteridis]GGO19330.1 membrane protein [Micromonospora parathelypteridis]